MDMWEYFKKKYPEEAASVNYKIFKETISRFNKKLVLALIDGQEINMGHHLGSLRVRRKQRSFHKLSIDWPATAAMWKETGEKKNLVYHTSDHYFLFHWNKSGCNIKNAKAYRFRVVVNKANRQGPSFMLAEKLNTDPFAHLKFKL